MPVPNPTWQDPGGWAGARVSLRARFFAVVPAEEVVGPRGRLVEGPVPGADILPLERLLLPVRLESLIGPHEDAPPPSRKDLAPALSRPTALAVEEELGTLGLGTEEGDLGQGAVPAAPAAGAGKLDPVLQLRKRRLEECAVDLPEKGAPEAVERGMGGKGEAMKKPHDPVAEVFCRPAPRG